MFVTKVVGNKHNGTSSLLYSHLETILEYTVCMSFHIFPKAVLKIICRPQVIKQMAL